jgi:arsenate reductase
MSVAISVWQYPKCSTCRKALKWMTDHDVAFDATDIVTKPPSATKLRDLWKR